MPSDSVLDSPDSQRNTLLEDSTTNNTLAFQKMLIFLIAVVNDQ